MNDVLFDVLKAVVMLAIVLLARYAVPYARSLVEDTKYEWLARWVESSVRHAEQTVFGDKAGPEKKAIVTEFIKGLLLQKNISISDEQLETLIESAVYTMNREAG